MRSFASTFGQRRPLDGSNRCASLTTHEFKSSRDLIESMESEGTVEGSTALMPDVEKSRARPGYMQ